jgi:beta-glucosidase
VQIEKLLRELTVEEKAALLAGTDFFYTNAVPRLNIPTLSMADGPHGLRKQKTVTNTGATDSEKSTAVPPAATMASSWRPENTRCMGQAIAEECRHYGVQVLLGPGVNIKRNPLCGRNFEYFSEDPLLAGAMGSAEVEGIQSENVGACVKHFALNNSEDHRFMGNSVADERAMREIYLKPFEQIVKTAHPASVMCAYNQVNGTFCSENSWLLTRVLRREWGFDGLVMTDWGAAHDRVAGVQAGLDLEMPGDTASCRRAILDGVKNGTLSMADVDRAVGNVLRLVDTYVKEQPRPEVDWQAHHALSAEIAADGAVLLKNNGVLPLRQGEKLFVAGDLFTNMRYQGAGSSMIHPTCVTTVRDAFDARQVSYEFAQGYRESDCLVHRDLIEAAVRQAASYDTVVVFAGLTDMAESEGGDRREMSLPRGQLALLEALIRAGKHPVVVLFGGSPVELPFAEDAAAILYLVLPGQNGGTAAAQLLLGQRCPAGHLAETWPLRYEDVPLGECYGKTAQEVYRESIYVGYRYYLTAGKKVRYPFGYGLSYTTFDWKNLTVDVTEERINIGCTVTNTGKVAGAEVVQLYIKGPEGVWKPEKELRGFAKADLLPGEEQQVTITVMMDELRYFSPSKKRWVLETGSYECQLCSDCETVRLRETVTLAGEVPTEVPYPADLREMTAEHFTQMSGITPPPLPPVLPLTMESRFTDFQKTGWGRLMFRIVLYFMADREEKKALAMPAGTERENKHKGAQFMRRSLESNCLRSMAMTAGNVLTYSAALALTALANGHVLRAIGHLCRPIHVPPLPKDQKK